MADDEALRFQFGENWTEFLSIVDEQRVQAAVDSLRTMLRTDSLLGRRFLDAGSGSGLFSLAATRLGASVHSFDFDPKSVSCTQEMKRRFAPDAAAWQIEQGSVLDAAYLQSLGMFDVVYSWGVLHHTGDMWNALGLITGRVSPAGQLFISIYNDQGARSRDWKRIKERYNRGGPLMRRSLLFLVGGYFGARLAGASLLRMRNPWKRIRERSVSSPRGMSRRFDLIDWVGGYPFEVAKPEEIFSFVQARGFRMEKLKTVAGGLACNEFVFSRISERAAP